MGKILICEDDIATQHALRISMERNGHETATVANGEEALEFLKHHRVDAVVADVQMPRLDGISLAKEVEGSTGTPVILVTGKAFEFRPPKFVSRVIAKPFSPRLLEATIAEVTQKS